MVDGGSAVDILMYDCFKQMKIPDTELTPADPIYSFSNHPVRVKGSINLPVIIGDEVDCRTLVATNFLVVDQHSAFNAIFGRPIMKKAKMITSIYCLTVKFPTLFGVGIMRSDQSMARSCHLTSLEIAKKTPLSVVVGPGAEGSEEVVVEPQIHHIAAAELLTIEALDARDEQRISLSRPKALLRKRKERFEHIEEGNEMKVRKYGHEPAQTSSQAKRIGK